jgi:phosphohistidine phosphatase SixA
MHKVAAFLADAGVEPALILSSPLPRALQTAEIAARELGVKVVKESALAPGFGVRQLEALLRGHPDRDVMLVGHEPSFSQTIRSLTGGAVKMAKGGVACVNVVTGMTGGELLWLIAPKLCGA